MDEEITLFFQFFFLPACVPRMMVLIITFEGHIKRVCSLLNFFINTWRTKVNLQKGGGHLWKIRAPPIVLSFCWTLVLDKILKTNNLCDRNHEVVVIVNAYFTSLGCGRLSLPLHFLSLCQKKKKKGSWEYLFKLFWIWRVMLDTIMIVV